MKNFTPLLITLLFLVPGLAAGQEHRKVELPPEPVPAAESPVDFDETEEEAMELNYYGLYNLPLNQLSDAGYRNGLGYGIELMSSPRRMESFVSLQFGGQFTWVGGGRESLPLAMGYPYRDLRADMQYSNRQIGLHGVVRLITPDRFPVQFYVQGMVGGRMFSSMEAVVVQTHDDEDDFCPEPVNLGRDYTLSYGAASGLRFRYGPYSSVDFRVSYFTGGNAQFVDLDGIYTKEQNVFEYSWQEAIRSEGLMFSLGITTSLSADACTPSRDAMAAGTSAAIFSGVGSSGISAGGCN